MTPGSDILKGIAARLKSPHADKIYVAKDYTKADLTRDLNSLCYGEGESSIGTACKEN